MLHAIYCTEFHRAEKYHLHPSLDYQIVLQQQNVFNTIQVTVSFIQFSWTITFYESPKHQTLTLPPNYCSLAYILHDLHPRLFWNFHHADYLTDFSPSRYMTQGRFIVDNHLCAARSKILCLWNSPYWSASRA